MGRRTLVGLFSRPGRTFPRRGPRSSKRRFRSLQAVLAGTIGLSAVGFSIAATLGQSAAADTATFTSATVGTTGQTPQFSQSGYWSMAWSFTCTGGPGSFVADVIQPVSDNYYTDAGPDENASSESGVSYYFDTGVFSITVDSSCSWTITVSPSSATPASGDASFSSTQTGSQGNTSPFSESGSWTMNWSYSCPPSDTTPDFVVDIDPSVEGAPADTGPNDQNQSDSGGDAYTDSGLFELSVFTQCSWTITVAGTSTTPTSTPTTTPSGPGIPVQRIYGQDAIGTSIAVSQAEFATPGSATAVVLARSDYFSDALAGGPLAAQVNGPLLITSGAPVSSTIDPRVLAEIERVLPAGHVVYVLGGPEALSPEIDAALSAAGYEVDRIAGADEFATAVAVADALGNPSTIFEATGLNFPDALSAVPAAIQAHGAILLTNGDVQAPETAAYLSAHPPVTKYAIGGPLAAAGADPTAIPIYGQDLWGTSEAVANEFFASADTFGAATGAYFADALSGGVFMGMSGHIGPMLLVEPTLPLPSAITAYMASNQNLASGYVFGGPVAVGNDVVGAL